MNRPTRSTPTTGSTRPTVAVIGSGETTDAETSLAAAVA